MNAPCPCYSTSCAGGSLVYGKVAPACTAVITTYCGLGGDIHDNANAACHLYTTRDTKVTTVVAGVALTIDEGTPARGTGTAAVKRVAVVFPAAAFASDITISVGEQIESEIGATRPARLQELKSSVIMLQPHGGASGPARSLSLHLRGPQRMPGTSVYTWTLVHSFKKLTFIEPQGASHGEHEPTPSAISSRQTLKSVRL